MAENIKTTPSTERETKNNKINSIETKNLQLTYSDGTEAVKGINLEVPRGEFFGFLGPNGAGKTTFIKMLTTLLKPTKGQAKINGFDLKKESQAIRESIGYMGQETSVDEELTAKENIRFACEAYGVPKKKRKQRIKELLELVELSEVANKRVKGFSGGMKKRLDAATALVHEPALIFLDEPTTGLDPKSRNKLWNYFERINNKGRTIFLTTQYLEEADRLCERLAVIQNGELITKGSPQDLKKEVGGYILEIKLKNSEEEEKAESITQNSNIFTDIDTEKTDEGIKVASNQIQDRGTDLLVKLRDSGIRIKGFNLHEPTLDDVFLKITGDQIAKNNDSEEVEE